MGERSGGLRDPRAQRFDIASAQLAAVHVAGAVDEIMGLIDQKDVAAFVLKITAQVDGRIKDIIIITDDERSVIAGIERQLKRTQRVFLSDLPKTVAVQCILRL